MDRQTFKEHKLPSFIRDQSQENKNLESNKVSDKEQCSSEKCEQSNAEQNETGRGPGEKSKKRLNYVKINDDLRRQIVFEVLIMKQSLINVSQRLGINFSSAKNVIAIFKKEGRLEKKLFKTRKSKTKKGEESCGGNADLENEEDRDIAPERKRCKLQLQVQPSDEYHGQDAYKQPFSMELKIAKRGRVGSELEKMLNDQNMQIIFLAKTDTFSLKSTLFTEGASISDKVQTELVMAHQIWQKQLQVYRDAIQKQ